jgi:uncharacterized protein
MNRRKWMMLSSAALAARPGAAPAQQAAAPKGPGQVILPDQLLLKDYRPKSVFKIPVSNIAKAKYPVIDVHHHSRVKTAQDVDDMVKIMDAAGVETTIGFCGNGEAFDNQYKLYSKYPKRFQPWCSLNMVGVDQPGFGPAAVKEIERCHKVGALGIAETTDKGMGIGGVISGASNWQGSRPAGGGGTGPQQRPPLIGAHPDDPKMDTIWQKCADLGMPISLHMSDPYWGYLSQDQYNDGLMNAYSWRMDDKVGKNGLIGHNDLLMTLEGALKRHPKTVFICCHLANLEYDLARLGGMFDRFPNMYADISARFCETAAIPRATVNFLNKYPNRICYGTDMPYNQRMFSTTYRILESLDEHFYEQDLYFNFDYHWPMHGFGLPDALLKKVYRDNVLAAFKLARSAAKA